jgi:hypothetical protein
VKFVDFERATVVDLEAELAAPLDEGAFGNAELGSDPGIGPILCAAFNEFLLCFLRMPGATLTQVFGLTRREAQRAMQVGDYSC